jgi:hypothetical protein
LPLLKSSGAPLRGRKLARARIDAHPEKPPCQRSVAAMAFTVIWYGKQGIVEKTPFDAEKAARDHALATSLLESRITVLRW